MGVLDAHAPARAGHSPPASSFATFCTGHMLGYPAIIQASALLSMVPFLSISSTPAAQCAHAQTRIHTKAVRIARALLGFKAHATTPWLQEQRRRRQRVRPTSSHPQPPEMSSYHNLPCRCLCDAHAAFPGPPHPCSLRTQTS